MISGRGGGGAKGSRIRPPRRHVGPNAASPTTENSEVEACWEILRQALVDIHNKTCSKLSFEELYRASYRIVLKKKGDVLYTRLTDFEEQWFRDHVVPRIEVLVTKSLINIGVDKSTSSPNERLETGERFLRGVRDVWQDHNVSMNMVADILMYLDRGYTQQQGGVPIFSRTIALFRDNILRTCLNASNTSLLVIDILILVMLDHINMERDGDVIDRTLIRNSSKMLCCLYESADEKMDDKLYLTVFEPRFIDCARKFYSQECERLLQENDATAWLRQTQKRLKEETDRCESMIELETLPKVCEVVDQELILKHVRDFLALENSGLRWMIDHDNIEDLTILYNLIARVDSKKTILRETLQKRVVELGIEIDNNLRTIDFSIGAGAGEEGGDGDKPKALNAAAQLTAAAIRWVEDVLRLKDKFDNLLTQCFGGDIVLQSALTKSFTTFIDLCQRSAEYVSLFIDNNLKRGIKGKTEAEVDVELEKAIILIRYLQNKDMFQTYYQRHLARRLLHGKSESHDVEKQIITRMKQELGAAFTGKFDGMFKDLLTSADLTSGYRDHINMAGDGSRTIDLHINVLTTNFWPAEAMGRTTQIGEGSQTTCTYPREIKRLQTSFEQFYLTNRNGRKLTWIGTTGSADVRCTFPAIPGKSGLLAKERRYEITVPTFAMVIMLLFNDLDDGESLSYEQISDKTGLADADLTRSLMAIAVAPKSRVLNKEPPTKTISKGDRFSFNASFTSKTLRIKAPIVNAVSKAEDKQQRQATEDKTNQTRAHIIDAAVVRIMKARKELIHSQLVSEVIQQMSSRFKAEVSLIKQRIEDLIARDYMERPEDEDAPGVYRYIA